MYRLSATEEKTCHNSCSGGIVIAVNPSFVATGDVQKSTAQTDMSVKTWGYGVMDSIGAFEALDLGSTPGTLAIFCVMRE